MEKQVTTLILEKGRIEIPQDIADVLGSEIKSVCMNDVWLLLTKSSDIGEPLRCNGASYYLPESQMSALGISAGDTVRLAFSEDLEIVILHKLFNDAINAE